MEPDFDKALDDLEGLSSGIDYALIGPRDNRVHEIRTRQYPFNTICHLGRDFGDGRWRGCTGTMIGPRLVLTAGHCIFSHQFGRSPTRIRVSPGRRDRDTLPYGSIVSTHYHVSSHFVNARNPDFDYGIIILPRPFPGITQFMALLPLSDSRLEKLKHNNLITIAGYPGDRPIGTLWRHTERLTRATPRRLFYTVNTCPGHSGSPVWFFCPRKRRLFILGVHTSGILDEQGRPYGCLPDTVLAPPGMVNSGVRVTPELVSSISHPNRTVPGGRPMLTLPVSVA
jgi:V8-like Glu-specific endopeptidase